MNDVRFLIDSIDTPLGEFAVVADEGGRLYAAGWTDGHARMEHLVRPPAGHAFALERASDPGGLTRALRAYFAGDRQAVHGLALAMGGTAFQRDVWRALLEIPWGETRSYRDIARRIGRPNAVRAVGLANGANPIAIVVPCHRVVGADGTLTGYGGGIDRKRWLLAHEAGAASEREGQLALMH